MVAWCCFLIHAWCFQFSLRHSQVARNLFGGGGGGGKAPTFVNSEREQKTTEMGMEGKGIEDSRERLKGSERIKLINDFPFWRFPTNWNSHLEISNGKWVKIFLNFPELSPRLRKSRVTASMTSRSGPSRLDLISQLPPCCLDNKDSTLCAIGYNECLNDN